MLVDDAGDGRNFFSREKRFRPSPAPLPTSRKAENLYNLLKKLFDYLLTQGTKPVFYLKSDIIFTAQ